MAIFEGFSGIFGEKTSPEGDFTYKMMRKMGVLDVF
jgi:hypothetical protein